jgi:ankyrin repeat protein
MSNVKAAVNGGVNVSSVERYGPTLLMMVAMYGKAADMEFLLAHRAEAKVTNKAEHTARYLVQKGADVRASNQRGLDAIMVASRAGRLNSTRMDTGETAAASALSSPWKAGFPALRYRSGL